MFVGVVGVVVVVVVVVVVCAVVTQLHVAAVLFLGGSWRWDFCRTPPHSISTLSIMNVVLKILLICDSVHMDHFCRLYRGVKDW